MAWVVLIAVLLLLAIIVYSTYVQKNKWKTVLEDKEMTEDLSNRYNYLLEKGIRCRLKESAPSSGPAQTGMAVQSSGPDKIRVQVHKDDLDKAQTLLKEYSSSATGSYSPISNL